MNRRGFFARCLAGAVLGLTRNLPMPAPPRVVPAARGFADLDAIVQLFAQENEILRDIVFTSVAPGTQLQFSSNPVRSVDNT